MDRVLALIATSPSAAQGLDAVAARLTAGVDLRCLALSPRARLLVGRGTACTELHDGRGAIVGTLFAATSTSRIDRFTPEEEARIAATRGQALIEDHWGGYVAFLSDADGRRLDVLRDPSGALGCYLAEREGLILAASDAELLAAADRPMAVDWTGLADHLVHSQLRSPRTALAGVTELLAGMRWTSGTPPTEQHVAWSPWRFAVPSRMIRDRQAAARRLRRAVQQGVGAWGLASGPVLLSLSGGLDSSLVAAALSTAGAPFHCFSYRTSARSGDERDYARAVAVQFGRDLTETEICLDMVDIFRSEAAALPRPTLKAFSQAADRQLLALAGELGSGAFMGGGGGDHMFCYLHSARPLLDRLRLDRDLHGWWQTARDIGTLAQCSATEVIKAAWARRGPIGRAYRWAADQSWLTPSWSARPPFGHPWLDSPADALPGSVAHVANILQAQNHLESARASALPVLHPLMSQPVMETCLTIPSYMWCEGGINRAVARRAFADILPPPVIARRSKGTPNALVAALYERHRPAIRERLLDGALVANGLADPSALERALADNPTAHGPAHQDLMRLLDVETWLELWLARGRQPRARA